MTVEVVDRNRYKILDEAIIAKLKTEEFTQEADVIILCSGDEDYQEALDLLVAQGKQIEIVSIPEKLAGSYLDRPGYSFIDLTNLKEVIGFAQSQRLLPNRVIETKITLNLPPTVATNFRIEFFEFVEKFAQLAVGEIDYSLIDTTKNLVQ